MCQPSFDERFGRRFDNVPPNAVKAMEYLRDLESKYTKMQVQPGRSTCSYIRTLNSLRLTQVTLQVKGVHNLNVAGQQVNLQASDGSGSGEARQVTGGSRE